MVGKAKQRPKQHIIDSKAQDLFRSLLPSQWVVRDYRPDYGIDFSIEIFGYPVGAPASSAKAAVETLGEHLLVQLKGVEKVSHHKLKVYGRYNVEKAPLSTDKSEFFEISTVRLRLDTAELVTVQRMGSGLPLLLVVADLEKEECYFLCLNDYIDKVLIPSNWDYATAKSRTIQLPAKNKMGDNELGIIPLRWYAKRPKLYTAFQKFHHQYVELQYAFNTTDFFPQARHFANLLDLYDFWQETEMWAILGYYYKALRNFIEKGTPGLMREVEGADEALKSPGFDNENAKAWLHKQEVLKLWEGLAVLPRNYEELCREWYLPTPVGIVASYPD